MSGWEKLSTVIFKEPPFVRCTNSGSYPKYSLFSSDCSWTQIPQIIHEQTLIVYVWTCLELGYNLILYLSPAKRIYELTTFSSLLTLIAKYGLN